MPITYLGTDKPVSQKFLLGFLFVHGFLFLGVGYILSTFVPAFTIIHSGFGIFVYLIFLRQGFPKIYKTALIGAVVSVILGVIFGDFLISNFYPDSFETNVFHRIYSVIIVFYIYLYFDIARMMLFGRKKLDGKIEAKKNQKR